MENVEYSQDAQVVLFEDADRHIWASFRKVPAYSPEQFHEAVIGGGFGPEPHKLAVPLYYVGPELSDPTPAVSERMHRFEWMRGFALLVPENQLLFHGQPFPHAELVLTYGDIVTALKVLPGDTLSAAIDPDLVSEDLDGYPSEGRRRSVFDIYEHFIQFSIGRTLYGQRKANVVHVLSLEGSGSDLRINRIQGFESVPEISERLFGEDMREFQPVANLDKASLERLKTRWPDRPGNPTDHFILGRLDVEAFEETVGKSLVYKHVRLTFQPDVEGSPLNNGELIFMRAGRLVERANDIFLEVRRLARLDPADIGPDFMEPCRLKRRAFSVREDLLYRILGDLGADYLKNMEVLVRLSIDGDRIGVSLQHGLNRLERALQRAIQASGGGLLFASVLSESSGGTLRVELKPGLFVQLPYSGPEQLQKGDVVAIQHVCGVYRVAPVAPAQSRYLESGPRPAVALPMDSLFSNSLGQRFALDENKTWLKKPFCFALGGLASVVAQPGSYNTIREEWTPPVADDFVRLMRTSPPHIVTTGLDHFGSPRIAVQSLPGWVAGRLELIESSLDVLGRTFDGGNLPNEARLLDWLTLTFGDESVRDVVGRTRQGTWKYHDRLTGYWKSTEGARISSWQSTQAMSAFDGPVFFQGKEWRLRYTPDNFLRAGFPVQELVDSLRCLWMSKPRRYPVAGPSEVVDCGSS